VRDLSGAARSLRSGYPIEFAISGPDRARVQELAGQLVARLSQDRRLADVWSGPRPAPSLAADIDRAKAATMGLPLADISASIQAVFGCVEAGNFTGFDRTWPVGVQVDSGGRTEVDAFNRLMVRTEKGQMVPLRQIATLRQANEPARLERLDLLPTVSIAASLAGDLSPAEARFLCERRAVEVFPKQGPQEYRLVWLREMPAARQPAGPEPPPGADVAPSVTPRPEATVP
jgi:multidrug efflux pump